MKVNNMEEAWNLAGRLFPSDYEKDEDRSRNAGYPIYNSTNPNENAWISDLGDRLELNYPNGSSENIWIEQKPVVVVFVGFYYEEKVFGNVSVRKLREIPYHNVQGFVNKTLDDGRPGIEFTMSDGTTASFACENVGYVRFNSVCPCKKE